MSKESFDTIAADKTITKKERMIRLHRAGATRKEIMALAKANAGEVSNAIKAAGLQAATKPPMAPEEPTVAPTPSTAVPDDLNIPQAVAAARPAATEHDRFIRALKSSQKMTNKELMAEFGIRDDQQMYGTAKRGTIFDRQYSMLSENGKLGTELRELRVLSKVWPITTTVTQKLTGGEDQHRYENGEDTESEYGVRKTSEINIGVFDKKTGTKIGINNGSFQTDNSELSKAMDRLGKYFNAHEKKTIYVVRDGDGNIPTEAEVPFGSIMAKYHASIAAKKVADAWKKEKVPAEKKQAARAAFSAWQRDAMKAIKSRLSDRGFKRGHPAYYEAEQKLDVLRDYISKLIQHPIFYVYGMGYDYEVSFYEQSASTRFQFTASGWDIKAKNQDDKYGWKQFNDTAARILAEDVNPILGTKFSSSGYSYSGNRVGFDVYAPRAEGGAQAPKYGASKAQMLKMDIDEATTEDNIADVESNINDEHEANTINDADASALHYKIKLRRHRLFGTKIFAGGTKAANYNNTTKP